MGIWHRKYEYFMAPNTMPTCLPKVLEHLKNTDMHESAHFFIPLLA